MEMISNHERRTNMLCLNFTEKLLGLQGVKIKNIEDNENNLIIHVELERKSHKCACCGMQTNTIHD